MICWNPSLRPWNVGYVWYVYVNNGMWCLICLWIMIHYNREIRNVGYVENHCLCIMILCPDFWPYSPWDDPGHGVSRCSLHVSRVYGGSYLAVQRTFYQSNEDLKICWFFVLFCFFNIYMIYYHIYPPPSTLSLSLSCLFHPFFTSLSDC